MSSTEFNLIYFATFSLIGLLVIPIGIILDRHPLKRTLKVLLLALFISQITVAFLFTVVPPYFLPMVYIMRSLFGLAGEVFFLLKLLLVLSTIIWMNSLYRGSTSTTLIRGGSFWSLSLFWQFSLYFVVLYSRKNLHSVDWACW